MACPETPTPCEQAALDLASIDSKMLKIASGEGLRGLGDGDQNMERHPPDLKALDVIRRRLQARVDRCNGCGSGPWIQHTPSDR